MNLATITQQIENFERQVAMLPQNVEISSLAILQQQVAQVGKNLAQIQKSNSPEYELVEKRLKQLNQDIEVLVSRCSLQEDTIAPRTAQSEYENLIKNNMYLKQADSYMDEAVMLGKNTLQTLLSQGERIKRFHEKVNSIAAKIEIGDSNLSRILHLQHIGTFLGLFCVVTIIIVWILFTFVI